MDFDEDEQIKMLIELEERQQKEKEAAEARNNKLNNIKVSTKAPEKNNLKEPSDNDKIKIKKEHLSFYYENFFPFKAFFKWLGKSDPDLFEKREISYTLENDIYVRFLCFKSDEDFKKDIIKALPIKIDIGAIFNTLPKYHNTSAGDKKAFFPIQKDLVFDIDMTDYDLVRTCCSDAKICGKCWKFMIVAYEIINSVLTEDFGFEHILWIFSGRRGIHCWISDERAKNLLNDGRSAVANFIKLNLITDNQYAYKTFLREPLHPSTIRSIEIVEKYFDSIILEGQDALNHQKIQSLVINIIRAYYGLIAKNKSPNFERDIFDVFNSQKLATSQDKWNKLVEILKKFDEENKWGSKSYEYERHQLCLKEIKLNILYPRLDINVSKHLNHLLKAPFCIHPKTGLISVPLEKEDIYNFNISTLPNIFDIIENKKSGKKTELDRFLGIFENFANNLK